MPPTLSSGSHDIPRSVEEIAKQASGYEFNTLVPFRYWLRTATSLVKEADVYEHEGDIEHAYFLRFRHAHLILTNLSTHPEATDKSNRKLLAEAKRDANADLAKLETTKPKIKKNYEQYQQLLQERRLRKAERERQAVAAGHDLRTSISSIEGQHDVVGDSRDRRLNAGENLDLAVSLAKQELPRRIAERKATRRAGVGREEEHRRRQGGVWDGSTINQNLNIPNDDLSKQLQEVGARIDSRPDASQKQEKHRQRLPLKPETQDYSYPSVPSQRQNRIREDDVLPIQHDVQPPRIPPKGSLPAIQSPSAPLVPSKTPLSPSYQQTSPRVLSPPPRPPPPPTPSASTASQPSYTFASSAHLENGTPLRTLFLPPKLRHTFLALAHANTAQNLETCGVLAGSLIANALFISHLIIPDQTATSDTCETINESALFDFVDSEDLLVFGWIHTHPTQSCFMSSRDLHTHCGYQVMMAESIAIVCAPSVSSQGRDWGCFRLTDPPGMKTILGCRKEGVFHPHEGFGGDGVNGHGEGGLYVDTLRPGHVVEAGGLDFVVKDLRPGK